MESETTARPIIRIEIQNDIASNQMDVDTTGEIEDGEVSGEDKNSEDCDDENKKMDVVNSKTANVGSKWWNKEGGFSTGFDIFSKNEQEKLTVRARRFGIHPNESKAITDAELQELYDSLNITPGDEKMVRFDALHMRGVEEMSTKDVFGYFSLYAPSSIEWINDYSCNVVWQDNVSASRALHGLSKRINGFDFTDEENPFVPKEPEDSEAAEEEEKALNSRKGRSILLISQEDEANNAVNNEDWESEEPIDITEISIPIPPGYWRYGQPHPKAKSILLRFAFKTDKKPFKAEKLSEYYKKYGNPNFGGMKGLISQSRKRQLKGGLTERQVLVADDIDIDPTGKNPWGTLAERWSNEDRGVVFNEPKEIIREPFKEQRIIITNKSLQERIGVKRRISQTNSLDDESETVESSEPKRKKLPRMRMYADEEQERINRLKTLKKMSQTKKVEVIDKQIVREQFHSRTVLENNTDLRNRLLQTDKRRLPEITVRVPQTIIEDKRSISHRFENRLGSKVTKNTFRSSSQYEDDRVHYRISERVYQSEEEDLLEEDDYIPDTRQRSTVKVVVRNRPEPKIQSTISRGTSSSRRSGESRSWRMSDREQFRSKRYEDERDRRSSDLRSKISDSKSRSSKLLRIKKEPSSDSSESSDSESESSSSESGSSSSDSDSSSDEPQPKKHTSVLKKTALPVIKSDKKLLAGAKDTLRIEVHNDSYKKT